MGGVAWDDPRARATRGLRRPSLDARSRDHPNHPFKVIVRCGVTRGTTHWRAGVGWVRRLAFLSILRECSPVVMYVGLIEDLASLNRLFIIPLVPLVVPVTRMWMVF